MEIERDSRVPSGGPLLALDTSTDRAVVALAPGSGPVLVAPAGTSRQHGRGLVASIRDLLRDAGLRPSDLAAIGVGLGPGSFTGLRIGVTAAKTLAYSTGCPLYGFDSLEAIARNAPEGPLHVVAIGDAQRGDLFAADFERGAPGLPLWCVRPTRLERTDAWPSTLAPGTLILGPPIGRTEPTWPEAAVRGDLASGYPDGDRLIELLRERIASCPPDEPWFLEPTYVRRSAAEEKAAGAIPR
jgi:tRNA threonylcarbamoyladenosine biosynthesis protein TsaB